VFSAKVQHSHEPGATPRVHRNQKKPSAESAIPRLPPIRFIIGTALIPANGML
jgi:hypothetical protein